MTKKKSILLKKEGKMVNKQEKAKTIEGKFNKILKEIWEVLKHPVTILAIGTTIAIIGIVRGKATKEPVFVVSPPELIAQTVPEEEKLKILWEGNAIQNVALVKIGIWNQGSRYIDKTDISSTNPIRIKPLEKVDILAVQVIKTSRPTLSFDSKVETDSDGIENILVEIKGDEALEKFDGGLFHILFSGPVEFNWKVGGRIKGVPKGFQQKDWAKVHKPKAWRVSPNIMLAFIISVGIFFIIISIIGVRKEIREARTRGSKMSWISVLLSIFAAAVVIVAVMFWLILEYYLYLCMPPWL